MQIQEMKSQQSQLNANNNVKICEENENLFNKTESSNALLKAELAKTLEEIKQLSNSVQATLDEIKEERKDQNLVNKRMQEESAKASYKISLDIGGKIFSTTKNTLLRTPSYFQTMLSTGFWKPDASGNYFVGKKDNGDIRLALKIMFSV